MLDIKHILCAIDFSKGTTKVVEKAITISKRFDAKLTVLTVVESLPISVYMYLDTEMEKETQDQLYALGEKYDLKMTQIKLVTGYPKEVILNVAKELAVDLIVMGSHGHYGITRHLLGSTTRVIANAADCDVYIVRC